MIGKALHVGTQDATIFFHAGMIHAKLGNQAEAQKYLAQALRLNPEFHTIYAGVAANALKQLGTPQRWWKEVSTMESEGR